ncbi:MAG: DUF3891 family protein [Acidobacteriota bacterium]
MILHPNPPGVIAITQSAHALMAFQIAEHWGNRHTPRPSARSEVLAAVMLHDSGWDRADDRPRLAPDGGVLAFDALPEGEREVIWRSSVEQARARGRYVAFLVSSHASHLAGALSSSPHAAFLAAEADRRESLRASLEVDPRYAALLGKATDTVNTSIVRLCDALAVRLAMGTRGVAEIGALPTRRDASPLRLICAEGRLARLDPWPLVGRSLDVTVDGRALLRERFADEASLHDDWTHAADVRLTWTLRPA